MKRMIMLIFCLGLLQGLKAQNNVDTTLTITKLNGDTVSFARYYGTKLLIVVLPVTQTAEDSGYMYKLDSISSLYAGRLNVIGVLSYEDGYADSLLPALQSWYGSLPGANLLVTQGMYTRRDSTSQHPLFNWLTHADQNAHFDIDVTGTGQTFFINEEGQLYSVNDPGIPLTVYMVQRLIQ